MRSKEREQAEQEQEHEEDDVESDLSWKERKVGCCTYTGWQAVLSARSRQAQDDEAQIIKSCLMFISSCVWEAVQENKMMLGYAIFLHTLAVSLSLFLSLFSYSLSISCSLLALVSRLHLMLFLAKHHFFALVEYTSLIFFFFFCWWKKEKGIRICLYCSLVATLHLKRLSDLFREEYILFEIACFWV